MAHTWRERLAHLRHLWRLPHTLKSELEATSARLTETIRSHTPPASAEPVDLAALQAQQRVESYRIIEGAAAATAQMLAPQLDLIRDRLSHMERTAEPDDLLVRIDALLAARQAELKDLVMPALHSGEALADRLGQLPAPIDPDDLVARIDSLVSSRHADLRDLAMQSLERSGHADALGRAQSGLLADLRRQIDETHNAATRRLQRLEDLGFDILAQGRAMAGPAQAALFDVTTDHPVAAGSVDHVHQRGSAQDDTRHPRFVAACERHFTGRPIRHMDLGCAGGGLVWDFVQAGHESCGIEGSDFSARTRRAYWRVIPEHLFTADITQPFTMKDKAGSPVLFDVITAWEVLEHIPEAALDALFRNIVRALRPGGLFAASVATFPDEDPATGAVWHVTIQQRDWWLQRAAAHGLHPSETARFATADFVRGSGNPRAHDWDAALHPELGFHLVLEQR